MNKQLRFIMPIGLILMLAGIIVKRQMLKIFALSILSMPSLIFLIIGIVGIVLMSIFAFKLDGTKAKNNWIEQGVNSIAQLSFLIATVLVSFVQ